MIEKVEQLIQEMTLEEKLGQLTQEYTTAERIDELVELAKKGELGSCILANNPLAGSTEQEKFSLETLNKIQRAAVEESRMGIPVIYGRDIIHGAKTIFPIPLAQAATWDYDLIKEGAAIMAKEASYDGVDWTFAPMLDICCDPRWGRIIECPGEDPLLGRLFARASVDGIQGEDMKEEGKLAACAKHFIGYGASQAGRDKDPAEWSDYSLRNRALPAFKEAVDANVATVMSSFNEISGQPATSSRYHLTEMLRGELGFDGFVVSDWEAVRRLSCQGVSDNDETSAVLAINAGVDMDMVDDLYKNNLKDALEKNLVTMETIDEAVRRVLTVKYHLGLFDKPYKEEKDYTDLYMKEEYLEKAKQASAHAMVLLKNNGILPLKKGEKVVVCGPYAEEQEALLGSWHAGGRIEDVVSLADGVKKVSGEENTLSYGCDADKIWRYGKFSNTFVVALGESHDITGEGRTMPDIEISNAQVDCAKTAKAMGKKVVAVIFAGRPLAIEALLPYCDAVLWAWHGGTMCGLAAAEILYGDFNPCGKLPITIPRSTGQIPIHYNQQRNELGVKGYYTPTPYVATNGNSTPSFVFGFGLSYTDFVYSDFQVSKVEDGLAVSFQIENIGAHDGYEIAQCYVCDKVASMARPVKELKAFQKVFLKKGEKKRVSLTLCKEDLSFYNARGSFVFEAGEFVIEVGKNCRDICFETTEYLV